MKKPASLRAAIVARNPELVQNPDRLKIYVRGGNVAVRYGDALGYQYNYDLLIEVRDFGGAADNIIMPVTLWLKSHQPDLLLNHQTADQAIGLEVDILDAQTVDIDLTLRLTESVDVLSDGEGYQVRYRPEPPIAGTAGFDGAGAPAPLTEWDILNG
ncbi:MAG: phage tail protein [Asticcacaulis sp.]